jgi:pyruvate dehydrogenase E2 component (dihydrolipoamide acetyltransferase)
MASVVRMPSVLADATEAAIANWLVAAGDTVAIGDPLVEIETEKAIVEYQAEEAGIVGRLVLAAGEAGEVGAAMAVLIGDGETDADIDAALGGGVGAAAGPAGAAAVAAAVPGAVAAAAPAAAVPGAAAPAAAANGQANGDAAGGRAGARIFASPLVRKIALEKRIDLGGVSGTGPGGRIVRRDIARLEERRGRVEASPGAAPSSPTAVSSAGSRPAPAPALAAGDRLIPHTPSRRAIARRLTESKATTPHFYMATECVVDELIALRGRINQTAAVKVSVNDFVVMAVAAAFADVPEANVTWSDEGLVAHGSVDVSIAVATEGGLVTPVLRGVEGRRLSGIARETRALAERARERRLLQHELEGGTFAVSNLGMYGTLEFSAIINPPQSGILAVGAARPQPVVADGAVTVATVIKCMLSVDHRAIDGALAARWLAAFTTRMQDPMGTIV